MHICSHGESSSKNNKKSTGTGSGTEDDSISMIHNNNKQHDVMAALAGWERRNKKETTFFPCTGQPLPHKAALAPAPVSHYFSHARALTALDETRTGDYSLLRAVPPQHGRASSGFGCVTADKTACHGCVGQGRATTVCCSLPAHTVAHR